MDKTDRLLDALEHPEKYSTSELKEITENPETAELYRILCLERGGRYVSTVTAERVSEEWEKLRLHSKRSPFTGLFRRKGVAAAAIVLGSFTLMAVGYSIGMHNAGNPKERNASVLTMSREISETDNKTNSLTVDSLSLPKTIVFENRSLHEILTDIAPVYGVKLRFDSETARETRLFFRWDNTMTLSEVLDQLNTFNRIDLTLKGDTLISR